jgi:plastocyanin
MMRSRVEWSILIVLLTSSVVRSNPQSLAPLVAKEVTAEVQYPPTTARTRASASHTPPAVIWLQPADGATVSLAIVKPHENFTLLQKNKMFTPHLLVVPVGSSVLFPNADPFFHNVFSLFDGKQFDLGLYEAGTSRSVRFSRQGVSYIFCNIHPEMSAIVLSLSSPYYSIADEHGLFHLRNIPAGEYEVHIWVEGQRQPALDQLTRSVRVAPGTNMLGVFHLESGAHEVAPHTNMFGQPYGHDPKPPY